MDQNSDVPTLCEALVHCGVCQAFDPRQLVGFARPSRRRAVAADASDYPRPEAAGPLSAPFGTLLMWRERRQLARNSLSDALRRMCVSHPSQPPAAAN
jgi:hypothetical protein